MRWCALTDVDVKPELVAVADLIEPVRAWFRCIPSSEQLYLDVLEAGKDLFAAKPFGIDLAAANNILATGQRTGRSVRCLSEFPFFPGAQRAIAAANSGKLGRILQVVFGFHHSSDLDATKPANWKRFSRTCGEIGVLGDFGMTACHIPLRLGWKPTRLFAQLQKAYPERPDGKGGMTACDTWDNAMPHCWISIDGHHVPVPWSVMGAAVANCEASIFREDGGGREALFEVVVEVFLAWHLDLGPARGTDADDSAGADAFDDEVGVKTDLDATAA
jgi:hypothetical protein